MQYVLRRVLVSVPVLFGISILTFAIMSLAPGTPLDLLMDPLMTAEQLEFQRAQFGFDEPFYVQYTTWLGQLLQGNLGFSFTYKRPVLDLIMSRLPATLLLSFASLFIAYAVALPLGIISGSRPYTGADYVSTGIALLTAATPSFFLGLVAIYVFAVRLQVLPLSGMFPAGGTATFGNVVTHLIMPATVLAGSQLGSIIRFVRGGVLEVMKEDFVRTARAKGAGERLVIYKHVLKNALIPVITMLGLSLPVLVGGAVIVEQVFVWPGIGTLLISAITSRDYPVIMGVTMLVSVAVLLGNLLADLAYGWVDPRVRYG